MNSFVQTYDYSKVDWDLVRATFHEKSKMINLESSSAQETLNHILSSIRETEESCMKIKSNRNRKSQNYWDNNKIHKLSEQKRKAFIQFKRDNSDQSYALYKKSCKKVKRAVLDTRKKYEQKLAENIKKDSKSFYSYVNKKSKYKLRIGPLKTKDPLGGPDTLVEDDKDMANLINNTLGEVFTESPSNPSLPDTRRLPCSSPLSSVTFNMIQIRDQLGKMKSNTSPGPDGVRAKMIIELKDDLSAPLTHVLNESMRTGEIPYQWKLSNVAPIFKKGNSHDAENYRGVSMEDLFLKTGEKIIKNAILGHLLENKMLNSSQHGFLPKKSTVTNLIEYLDDILRHVDRGECVAVFLTDFSKCFDKLPKHLILHCLEKRYSIEGKLLRWIKNWIEDRKQRVVLNGEKSEWIDVKSGCVQGSTLGPIIALALLDTVDDHINFVTTKKFADDNKFYAKITSEQDQKAMQNDIDNIIKWANKWGFVLNPDKCKIIQFGGDTDYDFYMNNKLVEKKLSAKDLGIIVDNKLNWTEQIKKTVAKARRRAYCMARALLSKDKKIWMTLYKVYVRSILEYALVAYCPYQRGHLEELERVQRWITRQVPGIGKYPYDTRREICHLNTLEQRLERGIAIEVYKFQNGISGLSQDRLQMINHPYESRSISSNDIYQIFAKTEKRRNSFICRAPVIWRKIPSEVKNANNIISFKNVYDGWKSDSK